MTLEYQDTSAAGYSLNRTDETEQQHADDTVIPCEWHSLAAELFAILERKQPKQEGGDDQWECFVDYSASTEKGLNGHLL